MELTRNQTHYIIMSVIYNELIDFNFGNDNFTRDARELISGLAEVPFEDVDPYIVNTVMTSLQKYGEIKKAFEPYLKNWRWERLPLLTQAILLMSYTHYHYIEKVDKKIVINIAVTLAKKYIDDKQAKFINGILDNGVLE